MIVGLLTLFSQKPETQHTISRKILNNLTAFMITHVALSLYERFFIQNFDNFQFCYAPRVYNVQMTIVLKKSMMFFPFTE